MAKVFIPHRIPYEGKLARILKAGMVSPDDVNASVLRNVHGSSVDTDAVITELLDGRDPPWVDNISGTLELAVEDSDGNTTGEIVAVAIVDGVAEVPDQHVAHALAGVAGAHLIEENG